MKKKFALLALCFMCAGLISCGNKNKNAEVPQSTSGSEAETVQTSESTDAAQTAAVTTEQAEAAQPDTTEEASAEQSEAKAEALTEEQALNAVKNYCFTQNPDLKSKAESAEYNVYWDVTTNDANEIVVLFRSYTGAQIRYYIDPVSGAAYTTELVPGIIDEEQRTEESLNVRDYLT
ncbi:MAG: hypothetical protein K6A75_04180 [Ruminococcus sp.]|nr:hypothetical protein [Ruminococcus sp.]